MKGKNNMLAIDTQITKRTSVTISALEYEALLNAAASEEETQFLLREPNGSILLQRVENIRHGRNLVEHELLPDED